MNTQHSSFRQPDDRNVPVWKYFGLAKLISLLSTSSLYLSRCDLLGDPFEGSIPVLNANNIHTQFCDPARPDLIIKVRAMLKLFTYVSCWHANPSESEAMWKQYCPSSDGVALLLSYSKLAASITGDDTYIGLVRYIDYRSEYMPLDNVFNCVMHKRRAFEHEREVRIIRQLPNQIASVELDFDEVKSRRENPAGLLIPIDLDKTIDAICVNPYAPTWYFDAVRSVLESFSIRIPLRWSQIADSPMP